MFRKPLLAELFRASALLSALMAAPLFAKTVTLTLLDNNTSICLIEGDTLVITLRSGEADTYRWDQYPQTNSLLTPTRVFAGMPQRPRGAQEQQFRFNASAPGKTTLSFASYRKAVLDGPGQYQTFSVDIAIASFEPKSSTLLGTYKGTTACADCTGIQTSLRLYSKGPNDFTDTIYVMTRTYLGGRYGDQSSTERGVWSLERGDAVDPNATVYALNPDGEAQYFLVQPGGGSLTGLDRQRKPIDAPAMYQSVLKRVE